MPEPESRFAARTLLFHITQSTARNVPWGSSFLETELCGFAEALTVPFGLNATVNAAIATVDRGIR